MKTKSNKLALVPASSSLGNLPSTQPPPRKADIIYALVERARVKHQEAVKTYVETRTAAEETVNAAILAELEKNPKSFKMTVNSWSRSLEVEYVLTVIPPHIAKLIAAKNGIPNVGQFDPAQVKRDITAKLGGGIAGDRVKALLANPEAVKKLDETLEAFAA